LSGVLGETCGLLLCAPCLSETWKGLGQNLLDEKKKTCPSDDCLQAQGRARGAGRVGVSLGPPSLAANHGPAPTGALHHACSSPFLSQTLSLLDSPWISGQSIDIPHSPALSPWGGSHSKGVKQPLHTCFLLPHNPRRLEVLASRGHPRTPRKEVQNMGHVPMYRVAKLHGLGIRRQAGRQRGALGNFLLASVPCSPGQ
jgi:hypothetical protein